MNSRDQVRGEMWSNNQYHTSAAGGSGLAISIPADSEPNRLSKERRSPTVQSSGPSSAPASNNQSRLVRPDIPTRASTTGSTTDSERLAADITIPKVRSEDLNHSGLGLHYNPSGSPPESSVTFSTTNSTRPTTPNSNQHSHQQGTLNGDEITSVASHSSTSSNPSNSPKLQRSASANLASTTCSACGKAMQGAFVRALGTVFHLNCFKCMDCGDVVASKFFPIDGPDNKQQPLCERDYFRRLNLICAKCNMALRGSYITACNKKFHVEHFTCSLCPTLFGPQDSYYEHEGDVYCHFHYSTRFATKCAGCNSAILKQFVEINRNMKDECWHPECYMINKFWNVKVVSRRPTSTLEQEGNVTEPAYVEQEQRETPASLKETQVRMEQQVYRIWTVLSAFEESSAACISDMLRQVSNGQYLDAIRMAEKFILHVEVLFASIDDLEFHFSRLNIKGMSHVREARMLCRKTVDLFTLLSHTQETGERRMGMTQELLALVTGLAHYLKILIRIALTGALKLERDQSVREAMSSFLDKLHLLAVQGGNPTARRMIKGSSGETTNGWNRNIGTQGVTYGFKSLAPENAGESPFTTSNASNSGSRGDGNGAGKISTSNPPSDLCIKCGLTVEEDCVRLGTYQRWHSHCVGCAVCGKAAAIPIPPKNEEKDKENKGAVGEKDATPKLSTARRPPANVGLFVYEVDSKRETSSFGEVPTRILCTDHSHAGCRGGFQAVSRLEQYAFLLNVALRRLYLLLKKQGVVPLSPVATTPSSGQIGQHISDPDPYRNSGDIMRMKSVHLDRKLSATARLPKRSTIVESPAGKSVHPTDVVHSQRSQELAASRSGQSVPVRTFPAVTQSQQPHLGNIHQTRPNAGKLPSQLDMSGQQGQVVRPAVSRTTTEVKIVDDSVPNSPAIGPDEPQPSPPTALDDGITLADIPQLMEAAQAREQQRSLPRESHTPYIAELNSLELAIVKHCAVLALHRSALKDQFDLDELLELVEMKKSGFWNKLFKAGNDKKNVKKKGVFGVPLELLVEREGSDSLLGATRATLRVPSFIDDVISAMRQMDMSIEGIFRKNGNIRRLKDLTEAIDRDPSSVELTQDNPVQLAALLKKFLRDLPDPLMTFKLHRLFIASQSLANDDDCKRMLHMISIILPKSHRDTMEVLFVFLKWVASFAHMDEETGSKMDLGNLATVICPSILYSRGRDAVRDDQFGAIRVVTALLEQQDEFYTVPTEFLPILGDQDYFSNSMELPGKDFMKKCDTYMRLKANGRAPPMTPSTSGQFNQPSVSQPRYPQSNAQNSERPMPNSPPADSSRSIRQPHPHMAQPNQPFTSSGSPRQDSEWTVSRPPNMSPSPRPASQVRPPPPPQSSDDHSSQQQTSYPQNGYERRQ